MRRIYRLQAVLRALIIFICLIIDVVYSAHLCPPDVSILPCKCTERSGEIQIWCSYGDLNKLMESLKSVGRHITKEIDELIIENNLLPSLPGQTFSAVKVLRLMLRNNGLQQISSNWLSGLETTLQEIYIVEPELRYFPGDNLITLPKLEALTLSAGSITRMPAIFGLSRLKYIQIEAPSIEDIPIDNFQGLPFLEQLHITSIPKFRRLEADFLHDLPKLSILNFTQCGLTYIHPRALARLPLLTEISFTGNKIKDARLVGMAIRDFPSLSTVRLDNNLIDVIEEASFVDMPLRNLYLNDNKIANIYRSAFHRLHNLRSLDLTNNKIRSLHPESFLPAGQSIIEEIRLGNNNIEHSSIIRLLLDVLPKLRLLDMSSNFIQDIGFHTLQGHMHLEILHLEHNNIQRIDRESFTNLPSLRELKLSNNSLSNYMRAPIWNLPALKGLDLSQNKFVQLDRLLTSGLPSLRRFDISYNLIKTVDTSTFLVTPFLEHLNLSHNAIDNMNQITVSHLQKLFDIDLSYNNFSQLMPGLPSSVEFLYMSHNHIPMLPSSALSDLQLPSLKLLDLSGNKIHHIPSGSFNILCTLHTLYLNGNLLQKIDQSTLEGLNQLRTLNLANNKLIIINNDAFKIMKHLTELNLGGNRLEMIDPILLSQNTELKKLDISQNRLSDSVQADFSANKKIEDLNIAHNFLVEFPLFVSTMPNIQMLDLSHNQMKLLPTNILTLMPMLREIKLSKNKLRALSEGVFEKLPNLAVVDLDDNDLERLSSHAVKAMPNLITIKLSRNKLSTIPSSAFTNLPALQNVELQENQLTNIASDAFVACPNLVMLNLSHNGITDMEKCGLTRLKTLEALDLSHNRIARFSSNSLRNMNFLIMLKIDNNRLCDIEGAPFDGMPRLRLLSLKDNKMTTLPEHTFRKLRSSVMSLDIEGNPIRCSCNMVWLQSWLQREDNNYPGPRCSDGILLKDRRLSRTNCEESDVDIVPGCEVKPIKGLLEIEGISTPPSTSTKPSNVKNTIRPTLANSTIKVGTSPKPGLPLPEESEYFDPKYVDYHETTTKDDTHKKKTIPPEILSHYIPGDTPTIYAGARQRNNTTEFNSNSSNPSSENSGFTFFGVPISSLNVGNFWNSGKSLDKARHDTGHPVIPSPPVIYKDGFIPMLPGMGGFSPVDNSTQAPKVSRNNFHGNHSNWNKPAKFIPGHATISKVALSVPKNERVNVDEVLNNVSRTYNSSNFKNKDSLFESSTPVGFVTRSSKTYYINNPKNINNSEHYHKHVDNNYHAPISALASENNKTYNYSHDYGMPNRNIYSFGHNENSPSNENVKHFDYSNFNVPPLSGSLVNNEPLSTASSSAVRPNISKVQLVPGPSPHSEDIQSSHLRLAKSSLQSSTTVKPTTTTQSSDSSDSLITSSTKDAPFENNWYFDNESQLKPYVETTGYSSCPKQQLLLPLMTIIITRTIVFIL